jgi:multidrug efflux pump subunit AcrA (membrane-fusion protein)
VRRRGPLWTCLVLTALAGVLVSCKPDTKVEAPEIRPVRTVIAAKGEAGETVVLTGHIQAEDEPALAFRIAGISHNAGAIAAFFESRPPTSVMARRR